MSDGEPAADDVFRGGTDETKSHQRFQTIAELVDDGVYQLDSKGRVVEINDTLLEETGYAREELLGEHASILFRADTVDRLERKVRDRLEVGGDDDQTAFDCVIEAANGGSVACELRFSPLVVDGEFDGAIGIVRTDEDRRRLPDTRDDDAITPIWSTYESLGSVIDEADIGVFVLDDEFDIVWINETTETYFGVDRSSVIGRDKRTIIEETIRHRLEDPETFIETVSATYDDNSYVEQFECRITAGPGRDERWLEHRSKPIESGQYDGGRIELYYDITTRKASEKARRESEQRFKSLVDALEEYALFMLDTEGRIVSWNEGATRIKGYDSEDVIGEHFSMFYTEQDRTEDVPARNLEAAGESGSIEDEGWRVRADGSKFWANVTITAIRDNGELQGYAKVTRDMTDRRRWEQRLQHERDLVEQILETSPVGIAVTNPDGTLGRANERMEGFLGVSAGDSSEYVAGQRDMFDANGEFLPVSDRPASRAFETGEPVYDQEILLKRPGDRRTWLSVNATPITDERDTPDQVVTTATDITDLKELAERRKRELEEREKELAAVQLATSLLETGDQPVDELLSEFVTKLPQSFRYPDHTAARVSVGEYEATTEAYEPRNRQITAYRSTANDTPVSITIVLLENPTNEAETPFLEEEQELIETLATLVKIYFERREYIDELRAETRRLEQFAYAASHDLQEPLRMISSYLQLLEHRYEDVLDEDGVEFLEFAVDGAERMREMIDGLLAYSRIEAQGQPLESVHLEEVLDDVLADLEVRIDERNAEISTESLPVVTGDTSQLRQVFQNLLDNAIEYSDGRPRVHVSAEKRGEEWVLSVRDRGIGIDPDEADRIFEVFHRLHGRNEYAGTGIGLALAERIVERHGVRASGANSSSAGSRSESAGGEIWVESEPGAGSTFSFTLPAATDHD